MKHTKADSIASFNPYNVLQRVECSLIDQTTWAESETMALVTACVFVCLRVDRKSVHLIECTHVFMNAQTWT